MIVEGSRSNQLVETKRGKKHNELTLLPITPTVAKEAIPGGPPNTPNPCALIPITLFEAFNQEVDSVVELVAADM